MSLLLMCTGMCCTEGDLMAVRQTFTRSRDLQHTNPLAPECSILQQCCFPQYAEDIAIIHPSFIVAEDQTESKHAKWRGC